jgi:Fe-S-cluster containining protein
VSGSTPPRNQYNCLKCPGYCCTYPLIPVADTDVQRLADRFDVPVDVARRRYTKRSRDGEWVLRHQSDPIFDSSCRFLNVESRRCTIYEHRPDACRAYPGSARCGYYDFLSSERRRQEDPDLVLTAWVTDI